MVKISLGWEWRKQVVLRELQDVVEYADTVEDALTVKSEDFRRWVETRASKLPEDEVDVFYDAFIEDRSKLAQEFPNLLRYSLFVLCYSIVEQKLAEVCWYVHRRWPESPEPPKDVGVQRSAKYLEKAANVNVRCAPGWDSIRAYRHIRNAIVHGDGVLNGLPDELIGLLGRTATIAVDRDGRIQLTGDCCAEVVAALGEFFVDVFDSVKSALGVS